MKKRLELHKFRPFLCGNFQTTKVIIMTKNAAPIIDKHDPHWLKYRIRRQFSELFRLSIPIIIQRLGIMAMGIVDTMMIGHYLTSELEFQSLANMLITTIVVVCIGLMMGTMVLTSNAYGEKDYKKCGRVWWRSMPYSIVLGLFGTALCFFAEPLFLALDQDPVIAKGAAEICKVIALGIPMTMMMISATFFLESIHKPLPGMIMMLIANIVNVGLNYVFVYGHYGFDPMGAVGTAWATTIGRTLLAIALFIYVWNMKEKDKFGIREKISLKLKDWKMQRKIGYGTGLTNGVEHAGFAMLYIFAGWIGGIALSSMSITFNIFGVPFMIAIGISGATAVRVGVAYGRKDPLDMKIAGFSGLALSSIIMLPFMAAMLLIPEFFIKFFTSDMAVITYATPLLVICGMMVVVDCGQTIIGSALRGRRDVWIPTILYVISYLIIMVPLCHYLAFALGHGASGLMEGVVISSICSLILLTARFLFLCKQDEKNSASP